MSLAPMSFPRNEPTSIDADDGDQTIIVNGDEAMVIKLPNGGAIVDLNPQNAAKTPRGSKYHDANLAEYLGGGDLSTIASGLIAGIELDDNSRRPWLETRAEGISMLGLKVESPRSDAEASSAPVEGMSTVYNPLLLDSVIHFQANARGELLPAEGPVKVENVLGTEDDDDDAEELEKDLNYFFTDIAKEYYPDTDRALFMTGAGGSSFKKVYYCPIRQRPVSESVDAKDLIVSDATTAMANAARVTHLVRMKPSFLRRMQLLEVYRDVSLSIAAVPTASVTDIAMANAVGVSPNIMRPEDADREIYECYCELDLPGFEHKNKGAPSGLQLPYRVTIDKDSQQVLEVRRNWEEGDKQFLAKQVFVKYPFVPGLGFYDLGFIHLLGNTTKALTAGWRLLLDSGMFSNFPGFLYRKSAGRQLTNTFRVPPGGGVPVDIPDDKAIGDSIMALPYKDLSTAFAGFLEHVEEYGQKIAATAEVSIGEGNQNAPVGTTLALIEQATKIMSAVHKRLHAAQKEEFALVEKLFRQYPESFIASVKRKGATTWNVARFIAALNNASLSPRADPNTPSHMHRLMKAQALGQMVAADPGEFDKREVYKRILNMVGFENVDALFSKQPPGAAPPDPKLEVAKLNADSKLKTTALAGQMKLEQIKVQGQTDTQQLQIQQQTAKDKMEADDRRASIKAAADLAKIHSTEKVEGLHAMSEAVKEKPAAPEAEAAPVDPIADSLGVAPQPSGGEI